MLRLLSLLMLLFALTSCTSGVNVATTGAQAVYNRHGLQRKLTDQYITLRSYRMLYNDTDRYYESPNIAVASFNREVLLTGEISNQKFKNEITELIKSIPDVSEVHNMLVVSPTSSRLTSASDSWLTTKIKTKFMASPNIDSSRIKVVSENGTVFLMGTVFPEEAYAAIECARTTFGVQNVVKLFKYIYISKNENITRTKPLPNNDL